MLGKLHARELRKHAYTPTHYVRSTYAPTHLPDMPLCLVRSMVLLRYKHTWKKSVVLSYTVYYAVRSRCASMDGRYGRQRSGLMHVCLSRCASICGNQAAGTPFLKQGRARSFIPPSRYASRGSRMSPFPSAALPDPHPIYRLLRMRYYCVRVTTREQKQRWGRRPRK